MQRFGLRTKVYPALGGLAWLFGLAGTVAAAAGQQDPKTLPATVAGFAPVFSWLKDAWWLVPGLGAAAGIAAFSRKMVGEPWVWHAIHSSVESYREFVFREERGEPIDHHRVTLFRHFHCYEYPCCLKWPLERRLIPVERSGHLRQKTAVDFPVPDSADGAKGVAGQVWRTFKTIVISDLPDLSGNPLEDDIKEYARLTWSDVEWVKDRMRKKKSLARSFCGIPIRVKGREWGIIVIDSRSPTAVKRSTEDFYDMMGRSLSKLLERV
jgi:hypothetical protein